MDQMTVKGVCCLHSYMSFASSGVDLAARSTIVGSMQFRSAFQIWNGLGAGNIGDDLMASAFWRQVPEEFTLHVALCELNGRQRERYPERYRYYAQQASPIEHGWVRDMPGLLVGGTCITDTEGWGWPLQFLSPRLRHFFDRGLPVDALAIGADHLTTPEGRDLFSKHFLPVRSWTVRNEVAREALLELNVHPERIRVGADWSWLYQPAGDFRCWAAELWTSLGIRLDEPLIVVNVFCQSQGQLPSQSWQAIARTLDDLHAKESFQAAFFCNECRHPGFDRSASEAVQSMMRAPSIVVPNEYYSPAEVIALLGHATLALCQRYHFCISSVLAGTVAVNLGRAPKISALREELSVPLCGSLAHTDSDELTHTILSTMKNRREIIQLQQAARQILARRAGRNLDFFKLFYSLDQGATH
jgi:polysaccharide pyruvyl transferase WcaK-like protein